MSTVSRILLTFVFSLMLTACVQDAPTPKSPNDDQPPASSPTPTVTLSAQPTTVEYGLSTTLTWSSTDTEKCEAGGAWSGVKLLTGTEQSPALNLTATFSLTCTGPGGVATQSVQVMVNPPVVPPSELVITLSASLNPVPYNGSSILTWSVVNGSSCTASGPVGSAWTGSKAMASSQTLTALTTTATYTLSCIGTGGSASKSVTITVQPAPVPTVTLTANPLTVAYNGASTLTWSTANTSLCTGSGAWRGNKTTPGSLDLSGLTTTVTYTLSCSGAGGTASATATITVIAGAAGTITGSVDSSRINRNGVNKVYLFAGTVTPDDYDGDSGDPIASTTVVQNENACSFGYSFASVAPGSYTIAFTSQAGSDVPGLDNVLNFVGTANIVVGNSALTKDFSAARVLTVGPGKTYATPSLAGAAAQDGDVIEIDPVEYVDDPMVWSNNNLTLRGVGGRPHIKSAQLITNEGSGRGKGLWVMYGQNTVVENVEFSGAHVPDQNGAGIRADASGLVVCNSYFHDNEDGILGGVGEVLIEYSEFNHNGFGDGQSHNLYMDYAVTKLIFRHNYSHSAVIGHEFKSNAVENYILYNRFSDESGTASYSIDIPHGGLSYIIGNLIQQGPNTDNSGIVSYGEEGVRAGRTDNLYLVSNTLVNDNGSGTYVFAAGSTKVVQLINNLIVGSGTEISGPTAAITKIANLNTDASKFVNTTSYDYRLTATSPAINQGSDPGTLNSFDARPVYQYVHPAKREMRPSNGVYDIGAYEYIP